ncbi:fimbrial protein [Salmonella enterica subsp. diarizonae serovar 47:k:z53:[z84]]|nr:fimbrial protein [Salmonella enterica subsp. diarizonae serovar 47:k:z53:[z84]]
MKKSIIASVIAMGMASSSAYAADTQTGNIQFSGAVTAETCNIVPEIEGGTVKNTVELGTVAPSGTGDYKNFAFKAANPADPACVALGVDTKTATVSFSSGALNGNGLGITRGTASDAYVMIESTNAKSNVNITQNKKVADFTADKLIADGLKFKAALKGGAESGNFDSAITFSMAYK